ncbi:unnamed protein product [marine sediment metagenome]|uniref:Uncharacterized protein n=1 Tax=marine sediment metagenome TaxID=412755 RepID=X1NZC1_9ZZZZ
MKRVTLIWVILCLLLMGALMQACGGREGEEKRRNLSVASSRLAQGYRRVIDIGRVEGGLFPQGRYFGNGVGIGFDAAAGFEAQKMKHLHGFLGYLIAALKTIFLYYRAPLVRIEYNEQTIEQPSLMISIMNAAHLAGDA